MTHTSHAAVPRNPIPGFVYGSIWLLIALILGILLLTFSGDPNALSETSGQRTAGFIVLTPFIALAASIFCFARAAAAKGPYKHYISSTTPLERQKDEAAKWKNVNNTGGLTALTVIAILGWLALLILLLANYETITSNIRSLTSFIGVFLLFGLGAGSLLRLVVRIRSSRRT